MSGRKQSLAGYKNLNLHRTELGWSIPELRAKTDGPPSERSVRRLESGYAIRAESAHKLFNVINAAKGGTLARSVEIELVNSLK